MCLINPQSSDQRGIVRVSATQKYALIRMSILFLGHVYLSVSKTQEIVVEKVMKIVQMLDISNILLHYFYVMKEKNDFVQFQRCVVPP